MGLTKNATNLIGSGLNAGSSVLGGLISGVFARKAATTAFQRQKQLMDKQNAINQANEFSSPSRHLAGMKAAGMNAAAALGNGVPQAASVGSASAPQADVPNFEQVGSNVGKSLDILQRELLEKQVEGQDASNRKTNADADLAESVARNYAQFGNEEYRLKNAKLQEEVSNIMEKTRGQKAANVSAEAIAENAQKIAALTVNKMQEDVDYVHAQRGLVDVNSDIAKGTLSWQDKMNAAIIRDLSERAGLSAASASVAAANYKAINATLPFLADIKEAEREHLRKDIVVLTRKAENMETEGDRLEIQRDIDKISRKYADDEHREALRETTSRVVLNKSKTFEARTHAIKNAAETFESGTRSAKNIKSLVVPWG